MQGDLRPAIAIILAPVRALVWVITTTGLGLVAVWRLGTALRRWRRVLAETLPCPRGHRTATYGIFDCRCGALIEGWVFDRCRVCDQSAGWMPCRRCGLPIANPLIR